MNRVRARRIEPGMVVQHPRLGWMRVLRSRVDDLSPRLRDESPLPRYWRYWVDCIRLDDGQHMTIEFCDDYDGYPTREREEEP